MLKKELIQADDSLAIETGIRKFIEWIRSGKLEVKLYRDQYIHAKVYIIRSFGHTAFGMMNNNTNIDLGETSKFFSFPACLNNLEVE